MNINEISELGAIIIGLSVVILVFLQLLISIFQEINSSPTKSKPFTISYFWDDEETRASVGTSFAHPNQFIRSGEITVEDCNQAIDEINSRRPAEGENEQLYKTDVVVQGGEVISVEDNFFDLTPPSASNLFSLFTKTHSPPPIKTRKRK